MVNALEVAIRAKNILKQADIEDAALEMRWLFRFVCNVEYLTVAADDKIDDTAANTLITLAQKRAQHYPLQYILGEWDFMGKKLKIGEGVLIPRPETETVVNHAAECIKKLDRPNVLDMCAGSGAISLGINALIPSAAITAVELYDEAYFYLQQNCAAVAKCIKKDALQYHQELGDNFFDLIISNPPYISKSEMQALQPELYYEPANALTDDADGLQFYKKISKLYKSKIKPNGFIVYEIGYLQKNDVCEILSETGYKNINAYKDYDENYRTVIAQKI